MAGQKTGKLFRRIANRRKRGVTFINLIRVAGELEAEGEISKDMTADEIAAAVLERIVAENPKAFEDVEAVDWDALLAFIERLLPIILQIIGLF